MVVDIEFGCYLWFLSAVLEKECLHGNETQKFFKTDYFQIMKKKFKYFLNSLQAQTEKLFMRTTSLTYLKYIKENLNRGDL